jgi:hypothetical protein
VTVDKAPAAVHELEVVHDTPNRCAPRPGGVGAAEVDQVLPFQDSASVWLDSCSGSPVAAIELPTATQDRADPDHHWEKPTPVHFRTLSRKLGHDQGRSSSQSATGGF